MPFIWNDWNWGWGLGWALLHGIGSLLWIAVLIAVVVLLVRRERASPPRHNPALAILAERYARGEIGRDEYLQKKADLEK